MLGAIGVRCDWCLVRLVFGAIDRCRGPEDGYQVPERPLKGHAFEAAGLIGRLH